MPKNILLVQDDAASARSIGAALMRSSDPSFHVDWHRRCADGLERLARDGQPGSRQSDAVAAVLLDLFLPDSRGIETFERVFQVAPHVPILVLSAVDDEEVAKLAVQHGAQDYLLTDHLDGYLMPKAVASMIERAAVAEALFEEKERAQVTLNSIGDAVISTDARGAVTYLNASAERLTGWPLEEAAGRPQEEVFHVVDASTRLAAPNPMAVAIRENRSTALAPNCLLVRRDGVEAAIEDSAAPIHDRRGQVTGAVMVFRDVSSARAQTLRMSHLAQHDSLTDLPNRVLLSDRLAQALALARRHRKRLAVLFLDVDRFKRVNDSLGHDVGDRLLRAVAARLLECVRSSDTVSRQGGDEFVILLADVSRAGTAAVSAEKILQELARPYRIDEHEIHVTLSIGIATYPDDGADGAALLKHADVAMYHAKDGGRNTYRFFKPEMNAHAVERQLVEGGLRRALQRGELGLHYQPQVDLATGAVCGVEALLRWHHPERGLLAPAQFMATAEESGVIVPMGRWVLLEACRQARAWREAGSPLRVAVNVSAVELRDKGFVAGVRAAVAETGVDPGQLDLELTETFLVQDPRSTAVVLRALKAMGLQLALDDFGTGYSSLSHLKRFPIDVLKIDRSFVRDLASDADDASIVSAVIGMGKSLHMRVVAEGVETREQLAFLRKQGCPEGQGFYLGAPVIAGHLHPDGGGRLTSRARDRERLAVDFERA
jgi:diguanylate cyclase (GGDEF)-like protein/PAS domain S-box-containing protein